MYIRDKYRTGNTTKVKAVAERIPPITTVARGRCTSAPGPVASAIGTKPKDATSAVTYSYTHLTLPTYHPV